jgi:ATP-dependent DNA helicase RecG
MPLFTERTREQTLLFASRGSLILSRYTIQVTRRNFGQPGITDYRNPHLAEAMKNLGYVQRFGVGIQIARRELEKNGDPPPEFTVEDTHVLVTVKRRP